MTIDEEVLNILNEGEVVSFMDKLCDLDKHLTESGRYIGMKNSKYGIYKYVRTNQKFDGSWNYDYKLISPEFDEQLDAIDWLAQDLLSKNSKQDFIDGIKEGSIKLYNDSLKIIMDLEDIEEGKLDTNPKFPTGDNKGIDPLPNYMLEPHKSKANNLRREYIQTHGKEYENKLLNEGEVVSFMDYKNKRDGVETEDIEVEEKVNPNEIHVHIDDVTIEWAEGPQSRFNFGKPMPYRDAQELLNEQDYIAWNVDNIEGGYDKVGYIANITVNGEPDTYEGRIDLGDGKYGAEVVSIKHNMQHFLSKHFEGKKVIIDNPDVDYPLAKYMQKYGSRKENMEKFVKEYTKELPQGTDYSKKSLNDIAVGDIFVHYDYNNYPHFFKVKKKTPSSIWVDYLKSDFIKNPVIEKSRYTQQDEIEYKKYIIPTDEVAECPKFLFIDTEKPFRLKTSYADEIYATQGRKSIFAWDGKPRKISESKSTRKPLGIRANEGEVVSFMDYKNKRDSQTTQPVQRRTLSQEQIDDIMNSILNDLENEDKTDLEEKETKQEEQNLKVLPAKNYKKNPEDVEVGDILVTQWGYSMTLVEYYRVTFRTKSSIKVEKLEGKRITDDGWTGEEVPTDNVIPDYKVDGKLFRIIPPNKQFNSNVNDWYVCKINGQYAEFWDGKPKDFDELD